MKQSIYTPSFRLGINLLGGGLLFVGICFGWLYPDQQQIGALVQASAAVLVGVASLTRGVRGMMQGSVAQSTDQLVAIAVLAAASSGDFFTAVSLPLLLDLVRIFEDRTVLGAKEAIRSLLALSTPELIRVQGGTLTPCSLSELCKGDVLLVRPGMRIGADGEVISGWSLVDTSAVTGETQAQEVQEGTLVYAGTQNISAELHIRVHALGKDSAIGRVITILDEAIATPRVQIVEEWIGVYVPIALCAAGTVLFFSEDLARSIALLIALCPTALAIAGPSTMVCALSAAARQGVLIQSRNAMSLLRSCTVLAIDKTGTLTTGNLSLHHYTCTEEELSIAMHCAQVSLHPVSRALVRHSQHPLNPVSGSEIRGKGVHVTVDDREYFLGRASWLKEKGIEVPAEDMPMVGSVVFLASTEAYLGAIFFADTLRGKANSMISGMRELGISKVMMLTGDQESEAIRIAEQLSIEDVHAELLPQAKAEYIEREEEDVLMVGDGVNDALALQKATVGIAFGSDLSQAVLGGADIAIQEGDLDVLPRLLRLAERTDIIVHRNIFLAVLGGAVLAFCTGMGWLSVVSVAMAQICVAMLVTAQSASLLGVDSESVEEEC